MIYYRGKYPAGGTVIACTYNNGTPYGQLSVCLEGFRVVPPENQIVVPIHRIGKSEYEEAKKEIISREIQRIQFGWFEGLLVELKDNWKDIAKVNSSR